MGADLSVNASSMASGDYENIIFFPTDYEPDYEEFLRIDEIQDIIEDSREMYYEELMLNPDMTKAFAWAKCKLILKEKMRENICLVPQKKEQ